MFNINVDVSDLLDIMGIDKSAKKELTKAAREFTASIKAHIMKEANQKLHTRRQIYIDALSTFQEDKDTFVVNLEGKALWIEDGTPERNLLQFLLASPKAKRAKDGSTYLVVPFQHNKGPTQATPAQQNLLATIKKELASIGVPYGKIENDATGKPKLGLIRSLDITKLPLKTADGPGQGDGKIGDVIQGPTGIPYLQGVSIHQKKVKDKNGGESVKRFIMTYRIASSKHAQEGGRWDHPGLPAVKLMDEAMAWAQKEWDTNIAPKVLAGIVMGIS